ncbi:MAG: cytochrome c peroxidase [Cocleimonas sp.]
MVNQTKKLKQGALITCFTLITACGGGSSGSDSNNNGGGGPDIGNETITASASETLITPSDTFIDQASKSSTIIKVQLKDKNGKNLIKGGTTVVLSTTGGNLSTVKDNDDGSYSATLTTNQDVSAITVSGKVDNTEILNTARVAIKVNMNTTASPISALGEKIYNDENLSTPVGQSCATCHDITSGAFDDRRQNNTTSQGADSNDFGGRNTPAIAYAAHIPNKFNLLGGKVVGGQFWDGRTTSLEEQARQPFLDAVEMGNPDKATLINKMKGADYANEFKAVFGANALNNVDKAFVQVSEAIAAFERTRIFSKFTSKWDTVQAGTETFTASEKRGEKLFVSGGCADCHFTPERLLGAQVFTNFEYENIGVPSQEGNPLLAADSKFKDFGLGSAPADATKGPHSVNPPGKGKGLFKVPTLRNIELTAPYMHNGAFDTLEQVVDFYNATLTVNRPAEVPETVFTQYERENFFETQQDKDDIIAFMKALTDK